jgi:SAM-dependent methyltransferase
LIDHDNLEEFADPDDYDIRDPSDTGIAFYTALAQETGDPVLEIACGTGRVSIPLARLGFAVTGLDIVPGMLARARSKSAGLPVRWIEGDARTFDLGEHFRLIFLTGNAFQAFLTRADQEALLARVGAHLHDEGLFAFETRNPHWANLEARSEGEDWQLVLKQRGRGLFTNLETRTEEEAGQSYTDSNGREVRVSRTQVYDHVTQILHWTTYRRWREGDQEQTKITRIAVRYTFPQELEALLHYNGFTILRQYGDWDLGPLSAASSSIIVVCRKREGYSA